MSSVVISGDTSGAITIAAPAVAGTYTQTLPQITGTLGTLNSGTAAASTSGTSIDFTSIPANVRRITVLFSGVSTNGTNTVQVQAGSGSVQTTGYVSSGCTVSNGAGYNLASSTSGIVTTGSTSATATLSGVFVLANITGNSWVGSFSGSRDTANAVFGGGSVTLSGTLDRVRITTVGSTDTFDAGTINIMYE